MAAARLSLVRTPADRKALRDFLARQPAEFIECRRFGHAWTSETVAKRNRLFEVTIRCLRCRSTATEFLDSRGYRDGKRQIHYVEGYLAKGLGRVNAEVRAVVRLEAVARM